MSSPSKAPPQIELSPLLRQQIHDNVLRAKGDAVVGEEQWSALTKALNQFYVDQAHWEGFLDGAQARALEKVRSQAMKLLGAIDHARTLDAEWFLRLELPTEWESLRAGIARLAALEIKTPRVRRAQPASVVNEARPNLQRGLDDWWRDVTQTAPRAQETDAPFMRFIEQALSVFPETENLGYSYKAIKDRQASAYALRRTMKRFGTKFRRLVSRSGDEG